MMTEDRTDTTLVSPQAKWNRNHRVERRARAVVANAIRRGKLERKPCCICNSPQADAHHSDYTQPLKIEWLCRRCHQRFHALFRRWHT